MQCQCVDDIFILGRERENRLCGLEARTDFKCTPIDRTTHDRANLFRRLRLPFIPRAVGPEQVTTLVGRRQMKSWSSVFGLDLLVIRDSPFAHAVVADDFARLDDYAYRFSLSSSERERPVALLQYKLDAKPSVSVNGICGRPGLFGLRRTSERKTLRLRAASLHRQRTNLSYKGMV
jgi:hypothetical protein